MVCGYLLYIANSKLIFGVDGIGRFIFVSLLASLFCRVRGRFLFNEAEVKT